MAVTIITQHLCRVIFTLSTYMQHGFSWEADGYSASLNRSNVLWKPKIITCLQYTATGPGPAGDSIYQHPILLLNNSKGISPFTLFIIFSMPFLFVQVFSKYLKFTIFWSI
jgi:hypothetical protein